MSSAACTILGTATLALLLAGYLAQHYLPPPKPKIVGIDLGTTYSCIGVYRAVSGDVDILPDEEGNSCIPSIVAFNGEDIAVGYRASHQAEQKPSNTLYDAKRFIGKKFTRSELTSEAGRYPFKLVLDDFGMARYAVSDHAEVTPEVIGSKVIATLRKTAEDHLQTPVKMAVMSVPAEFDEMQRNYTKHAAKLAGIEVLRIINEPTAAALAYGLHKKEGIENVLVIDLGGGTLDVSLLAIQGGMFLTQAMAGNNHLGGQDFNQRLMAHVLNEIKAKFGRALDDPEDTQAVRSAVEQTKLLLTSKQSAPIDLTLKSFMTAKNRTPVRFNHVITRKTFEDINFDLFQKVLEPVDVVLKEAELSPEYVDEVVLVGGSTRIPKVRELIEKYFGKKPNVAIDPELAVAAGVSIQAGIIGGVWPLVVSATELPTSAKKIHVL